MAHTVVWTERAATELHDFAEFIARDSFHYAELVEDRCHQAVDSLAKFPSRNRIVPELRNKDIREIFVYDFRIIYHIAKDTVTILSIVHSARDLNKLRRRRGNGFSPPVSN